MLKKKLTELENKIPDVSSLATKTELTVVENEIPSISSLVKKKTDYNNLAPSVFNERLAQANLITKTDLILNCQILTEKLHQINQTT